MAFNPAPKVAAARDFAAKFDAQQVIILYIQKTPSGHESLGYASFGKTKALCDATNKLADVAYDALIEEFSSSQ